MKIGGMFELEKCNDKQTIDVPNAIYAMSGRCALYACIEDIGDIANKVAYVPAYTCETVLGSYLKAGYSLKFYDIDPDNLTPIFKEEDLDGVGVLGLCGYFGFIRYDEEFVKKAHDKGIVVLHDTTHSPYYVDPNADYGAGSLRKWMGIAAGGVAVKKAGPFNIKLKPVEEEHIKGRYQSFELRSEALRTNDDSFNKKASETFWKNELRLREIFDAYSSDEKSIYIAKHFDYESMKNKRCEHFETIIKNLKEPKGFKPVFTELRAHDVPSHFPIYAEKREEMQAFLRERGISTTVYWPLPPMLDDVNKYDGAKYIYDHIAAIQLDQRYDNETMKYLADVLNEYSELN